MVKNPPANARNVGSTPELGRSSFAQALISNAAFGGGVFGG